MLKFQNNNTTVIATFEDFILTTYVIIDELYHQFALPEVAKRRHVLDAKLSDSEIITISLCGELYSGSVVKTKIQAFYNEPISVAELGRCPR